VNARIRYGPEADVFAGMRGEMSKEELDVIRSYGRIVLSFSRRVRNLPDEDQFDILMKDLEVIYKPDILEGGNPIAPDEGIYISGNRNIEVVNHVMVDVQALKQMSHGLLELAADKGALGHKGAFFIDHSTFAEGITLGFYNPLTGTIEED
jgi:hypothetical protein